MAGPVPAAALGAEPCTSIDLRYVARAGLLPELSGQTYDSFYKALREAVLNAADAGASRVVIDFSRVADRGCLSVRDDGAGMSLADLRDHFMSLGGSAKFGEAGKFGRIGIGSLALLQYSDSARIETKQAGSGVMTRARVAHPWRLEREERRQRLQDVSAGSAEDVAYEGDASDHYTHLLLEDVAEEVRVTAAEASVFYGLTDVLRRVLPLPDRSSALFRALEAIDPEAVAVAREHVAEWSVPVTIIAPWGEEIDLVKRCFGEAPSGSEAWSGPPHPVLKTIEVSDSAGPRRLVLAGYLLNQRRPSPPWTGLTVRVQNVAVETNTFFDVTSDPGFRKYISGEILITGQVDRHRLINIDRCSFNRECADYRAIARYMQGSILRFKATSVQAPQRAKVGIRRTLERRKAAVASVERVLEATFERLGPIKHGGIPSSGARSLRGDEIDPIRRAIEAEGGQIEESVETTAAATKPYSLDLDLEGRVVATVNRDLLRPQVRFGAARYALRWFADPSGPPLVIRNRPREIQVNTLHKANRWADGSPAIHVSLGLEIAYVYCNGSDAPIYDTMLSLMESL